MIAKTQQDIDRFMEAAKKAGLTVNEPKIGGVIDWSLLSPYRDMPVKDRPKDYTIGGGGRR